MHRFELAHSAERNPPPKHDFESGEYLAEMRKHDPIRRFFESIGITSKNFEPVYEVAEEGEDPSSDDWQPSQADYYHAVYKLHEKLKPAERQRLAKYRIDEDTYTGMGPQLVSVRVGGKTLNEWRDLIMREPQQQTGQDDIEFAEMRREWVALQYNFHAFEDLVQEIQEGRAADLYGAAVNNREVRPKPVLKEKPAPRPWWHFGFGGKSAPGPQAEQVQERTSALPPEHKSQEGIVLGLARTAYATLEKDAKQATRKLSKKQKAILKKESDLLIKAQLTPEENKRFFKGALEGVGLNSDEAEILYQLEMGRNQYRQAKINLAEAIRMNVTDPAQQATEVYKELIENETLRLNTLRIEGWPQNQKSRVMETFKKAYTWWSGLNRFQRLGITAVIFGTASATGLNAAVFGAVGLTKLAVASKAAAVGTGIGGSILRRAITGGFAGTITSGFGKMLDKSAGKRLVQNREASLRTRTEQVLGGNLTLDAIAKMEEMSLREGKSIDRWRTGFVGGKTLAMMIVGMFLSTGVNAATEQGIEWWEGPHAGTEAVPSGSGTSPATPSPEEIVKRNLEVESREIGWHDTGPENALIESDVRSFLQIMRNGDVPVGSKFELGGNHYIATENTVRLAKILHALKWDTAHEPHKIAGILGSAKTNPEFIRTYEQTFGTNPGAGKLVEQGVDPTSTPAPNPTPTPEATAAATPRPEPTEPSTPKPTPARSETPPPKPASPVEDHANPKTGDATHPEAEGGKHPTPDGKVGARAPASGVDTKIPHGYASQDAYMHDAAVRHGEGVSHVVKRFLMQERHLTEEMLKADPAKAHALESDLMKILRENDVIKSDGSETRIYAAGNPHVTMDPTTHKITIKGGSYESSSHGSTVAHEPAGGKSTGTAEPGTSTRGGRTFFDEENRGHLREIESGKTNVISQAPEPASVARIGDTHGGAPEPLVAHPKGNVIEGRTLLESDARLHGNDLKIVADALPTDIIRGGNVEVISRLRASDFIEKFSNKTPESADLVRSIAALHLDRLNPGYLGSHSIAELFADHGDQLRFAYEHHSWFATEQGLRFAKRLHCTGFDKELALADMQVSKFIHEIPHDKELWPRLIERHQPIATADPNVSLEINKTYLTLGQKILSVESTLETMGYDLRTSHLTIGELFANPAAARAVMGK